MADLKTTNIFGDAYINNKVGIATNTPATRLQIGQLSPTAATEGIQFGDDTNARLYRGGSGQVSAAGGFYATSWITSNSYLQTNGNLIYPSGQAATQRLQVGNAANNAWMDGITIAPGGHVTTGGYLYAGTYLQSGNSTIYPAGQSNTMNLYVGNAANNAWISGIAIAPGGVVTVAGNISASNLSGTNTGDQTIGNGTITIAAGTGVGVGTTNTFTTNQSGATTVTITNSGVTSAVAGIGVGVSAATGAVTFSIGQAVGTSNSPTFAGLTLSPSATSQFQLNSPSGTQGIWIRAGYDADGTATPVVSANNVTIQASGTNSGTFSFVCGNTKILTIAPGAVNSLVALQQSGNQVLHAGNYTSYSPSLTGTGASGTWSITATTSSYANALNVGNNYTVNNLRVTSTVGVGTTSPQGVLEVQGSTDGSLGGLGAQTQLWVSDNRNQTTGVGGGISFAGEYISSSAAQITFGAIRGSKANSTSANTVGNLELYAFDGDFKFHSQYSQIIGANTELVTIKADGKVGIGISTPSTLLHVVGVISGSSFSGAGTGLTGTAANLTAGSVTNGVYTTGDQTVAGNKTFSGITTFSNASDYQISLNGSGTTWAGIQWVDSNGTEYLWYNGQNKTFALGGGGSNVSGKKLHVDGGVTIGADYDSTAVLANGLTVQGAVQIGNYTTFVINGLGASATQARTFEIARIGIDYNDWNNIGTFEVELHEQYYTRGLKKVYNIWYGYVSNSGIRLVEWRGSGENNFQCRIGSQVLINGDSYYLPVYVDLKNYGYVDVVIKTNRIITTSVNPGIGYTYVNTAPTPTNISDFTADSDLEISTLGSAKLGGNTILTTATTSATGLSIGGNAATATTATTANALNTANNYTVNNLRVTSTVGIGTTSPQGVLEVQGSTDGSLGGIGGQTQLWVSDNRNQTTGVGGGISFAGEYINSSAAQTTFGAIRGSKANSTSANTVGNLELYAFDGDFKFHSQYSQVIGVNTELVTIKADGKVGIGRTSPQQKLHIAGTNARLAISNDSDNNWAEIGNDGSSGQNTLEFFAGSSVISAMSITNANNVGIGTTVPIARLHVNSTTAGATLLRTDGTNGTLFSVVDDLSDSLMSVNNAAGLPVFEAFADDRIVMGQYGQNDFVLKNNRVGIGTNNPQFKLDVTGSLGLNAGTFDGNWPFIVVDPSTSGGTNRYVLNKIGAMGFNYADSYAQLQLIGASGAYIDFGNATADDSDARVIYYSNSRLDIQYGTTMTLNSTGVGIGTTVPSSKLEVGNFLDEVTNKIIVSARYEYQPEFNFRLGQSGTNYDWIGGVISCGDDGNYNGVMNFKTCNSGRGTPTTKMVIKASGNVGIGTTVPSTTLHVNGIISGSTFNGAGTGLTGTAANLTAGAATTATNSTQLNGVAAASYVTLTDTQTLTNKTITGTFTGNLTGTATTASYANALNAANQYTVGGITGSHFGTSSWASNATTATTANTATALTSMNISQFTNNSGYLTSVTNISGNAGTATLLQNPKNIGGVSFNGSANIDLPGVNIAGNQNTSGTANTATTANALNTANNYTVNNLTVSTTAQLVGVRETYTSVNISSGVVTIDLNAGTVFRLSYNAVVNSFTINNITAGKVNAFTLVTVPAIGAGGINFTFTGTNASNPKWPSGNTPMATTTANKYDVFSFIYDGSNWYGFTGGLNY